MDLVQDSAGATGLGDAGKRVMEQYGLETEIKRQEKAQAGAGKAAQAKLMETYGGVLSKPYEEFKPSQESLGGFAALGSLLMVAGAMMGGKGRLSGIGAMNNIAGMMKGYQEGRKDLYEQERKQFEENMKTFEKNRGLIKEAFDRALKLAPTNLKAANDILRRDLQALGANVPAEMVAKSGAVQAAGSYNTFHGNTNQTLQSLKDKLGLLKATGEAQKADYEAKKRAKELEKQPSVGSPIKIQVGEQVVYADRSGKPLRDEQGNLIPAADTTKEAVHQPYVDSEGFFRDPKTNKRVVDPDTGQAIKAGGARGSRWIASQDESGKPVYRDSITKEIIVDEDNNPVRPAAKAGKGLEPGATERKNFTDHQTMLSDIDYLSDKLSDPEFAKKVDQYRVLSYLTDDTNKFFSQLLSSSIPDDLREFTIRANNMRNQYYLALSGKAVTGGEAQRNYGVVLQPGDSVKTMKSKLKIMDGYLTDSSRVLELMYPSLSEVSKKRDRTVNVGSEAEAEMLTPGTKFRLPDGRTGTVQ